MGGIVFKRSYRFTLAIAVLASAFATATPLFAQAGDAILGTWVLDRTKSVFSENVPEKRTMTFEKAVNGIRHTTQTQRGGSEVTYKLQYIFQVDGKDYPADNAMPLSTVAFKQVNPNTLERSGKYQGQVVETVTYQVSGGGKVLTVTQKGTISGVEVSSMQVFDRQ
jgi:hypothetical protein